MSRQAGYCLVGCIAQRNFLLSLLLCGTETANDDQKVDASVRVVP